MSTQRIVVLFFETLFVSFTNAKVPVSDFFAYGKIVEDLKLPKGLDQYVSIGIDTDRTFKFNQITYSHMFLSSSGGVSFNEVATFYKMFTPDRVICEPSYISLIMPFWALADTSRNGTVFYRQATDITSLTKAGDECSRAFPSLLLKNITWMFVATWDRVPYNGAGLDIRNTFQVALVTDRHYAFTIYNYNTVDWISEEGFNGDIYGLNGDSNGPNGYPAKAGFDYGNGINMYFIDGGCSNDIMNIAKTSNVGLPGKWIFRVDGDRIEESPVMYASDTPSPGSNDEECNPELCQLTGNCTSYFTCDPKTRRRIIWECSPGLFWNPKGSKMSAEQGILTTSIRKLSPTTQNSEAKSALKLGTVHLVGQKKENIGSPLYETQLEEDLVTHDSVITPESVLEKEFHGSCDVWDNLPDDVKASYKKDESCFPKCYYKSFAECSPYYIFHAQDTEKRKQEVRECPTDTRNEFNVPLVWVEEHKACDFCYNAVRTENRQITCCEKYDNDLIPEST